MSEGKIIGGLLAPHPPHIVYGETTGATSRSRSVGGKCCAGATSVLGRTSSRRSPTCSSSTARTGRRSSAITPSTVGDYQPVWGAGAALVESTPATDSIARAPKPVGAYPHAKRVGDTLFLSGIGPRQAGTDEIPGVTRDDRGEIVDWDIEVQTRAVIENVKTILDEAGSSLDKVIDVTVFLTNMKRDFAGYNKVYAEYFSSIQATRTTVGVNSLPTPIAVELKILAMP